MRSAKLRDLTIQAELFSPPSWFRGTTTHTFWMSCAIFGHFFSTNMSGYPGPYPWRDAWRDLAEYQGGP